MKEIKEKEIESTFDYKLIYVFRINDDNHKDILKIGDATIHTKKKTSDLPPFCHDLNVAAKERIDTYTTTAGITYQLLHTEIAIYVNNDKSSEKYGKTLAFRDYDVHSVLKRSGVKNKYFDTTRKQNEWFICDLETAKEAIKAVKEGKSSLNPGQVSHYNNPIIFRPEQKEAIEKALKQFRHSNRMLWNAKMRFGKTLSALEVAKRSSFQKTIIITHRPVVKDSWYKDFGKIFYDQPDWIFGSKNKGSPLQEMIKSGKHFVYFASIQDLRGSSEVGGSFNKNNVVFKTDWNFVVVDEAHEGTQTDLGKAVFEAIIKRNTTKVLELSGTPFNLLVQFDDNEIYTWDYIMEQEAKLNWPIEHALDPNPYEELPKLNIFTYHLEEVFKNYQDIEDKAFNFKEFFRTWTGNKDKDFAPLPSNAKIGDFVHEKDIKAFLRLICKTSKTSKFPFATDEYREFFRHTLWVVPGVKEAKALSELLQADPIFSQFKICNVAGEGDEEINSDNALTYVQECIGPNANETRTITLSCGRLTTGVTVPEWTAVLMLAGSHSTQAGQYLQTIFRVQSPANIDGKIKENCYLFEFAPDRALKLIALSVQLTAKGQGSEAAKIRLGKFLNYCSVITFSESGMQEYNVSYLLQELKKAYTERIVRNGFDDSKLYKNDELLKLDKIELKEFEELRQIIGNSSGQEKVTKIDINNEGFTEEELEKITSIQDKPKSEMTDEEKEKLAQLKKMRMEAAKARSVLRGISIRIPLLVYGADVPIEQDINVSNFPDLVDETSWNEFMPTGVTKEHFKKFSKYYDEETFVAATYRVRNLAMIADQLDPLERVQKITEIFSTFKNPDKETVLTPWRVVNLHMAQTIGGYCFFDENFEKELSDPRYVNMENVTNKIFNEKDSKILEINSKTGLYPLYVTYTLYAHAIKDKTDLKLDDKKKIWNKVVADNIYVICKTAMAKSITKRTLLGYQKEKINAHAFDDLVNQMKEKQNQITTRILKSSFWNKGGSVMKFNAVVGNPPYHEVRATHEAKSNGQDRTSSIFPWFQICAEKITSGFTSLIYPGARWMHQSGKGMKQFGKDQMNDRKMAKLIFYPNSQDIFKEVAIADGISIVMKDISKTSNTFEYVYVANGNYVTVDVEYPGDELMPLNPSNESVVSKATNFVRTNSLCFLHERVLSQKLFEIESNFVEENPTIVKEYKDGMQIDFEKEVKLFTNDKAGKSGRGKWYVTSKNSIKVNKELIKEWQVVVSSANAGGQKRDNQIEIIDNHSAFGRSRVALGTFKTEDEAINFYSYMNTDLVKFLFLMTDEALTSLGKKVPDLMDYTSHNKYIDFTKDLNEQVNKLFGLTEKEATYIHEVVINHRQKR